MNREDAEHRERTEAAAAWWMRLQKDDAAAFSAEFQEWLALSENEREFQAIELAMETLGASSGSDTIDEMRRSARDWYEKQSSNPWLRWKTGYAMAAAASLLLSIGAGAYLFSTGGPSSYHTSVGERRAMALKDGSHILLDSDSEVEVRYTKTTRGVTLIRGRARFDVAHDAARPFSVAAGQETVIAVGTSFNVELRGRNVLVTLMQGHVLIEDAAHRAERPGQSGKPLKLSPGQQLIAFADRDPAIAPVDVGVARAWENGHLVFRGERLADAVEQLNRYIKHPIAVDPSAASFRVSGVFNTADAQSFVSAATEFYPIEAVPETDGTITLRKAP